MTKSMLALMCGLSLTGLVLAGCSATPNTEAPIQAEIVMKPGELITATTMAGTIRIRAISEYEREYEWEGDSRSAKLSPRPERWNGSLGIYSPGSGDHWDEHSGVTRGVLEEGVQVFDDEMAFSRWLIGRSHTYISFVWSSRGLVVGWGKNTSRRQLNVEVWQVKIGGSIPSALSGAQDEKIRWVGK